MLDIDWLPGQAPRDMIDALGEFDDILHDEIKTAAEDLAEAIHEDVEELAPVDTGELRDSYEHEAEQALAAVIEARVISDVEHAPYQEFMDIGTPHVGPALEKNKETLEDEAENAWNRAVRKAS